MPEAREDMPGRQRPVALVTGSSRGLGAAIALRLAADGFDIWMNYRSNADAAHQTAQAIEASGAACRLLPFDVSSEAETCAALDALVEEITPAVLVNNAGMTRDGLMMWMTREDWDTVTNVTLGGFFNVTKVVLPFMLRKRAGRIINISSTAGQSGLPGQVNYSAAKAGLIGATKSLAAEVAKRGILVNAVAPGFIETDMTSELPIEEIVARIPLGRMGTAEEVAAAVSFLCSSGAGYITGQVLAVNGGIYM